MIKIKNVYNFTENTTSSQLSPPILHFVFLFLFSFINYDYIIIWLHQGEKSNEKYNTRNPLWFIIHHSYHFVFQDQKNEVELTEKVDIKRAEFLVVGESGKAIFRHNYFRFKAKNRWKLCNMYRSRRVLRGVLIIILMELTVGNNNHNGGYCQRWSWECDITTGNNNIHCRR